MESIEVTGRTVEEAIENAMDQLGVTREELKVTVIKEGKSGILGIGAGDAKILVDIIETQQPEGEVSWVVKSTIEELLKLMGFNASVEPEEPLMPDESGTVPAVTFNIVGDDDIGILIGRHGQTISSLQYLVRVIVSHQVDMPPQIIIDIDGYKKRRYESLQDTARRWRNR